MVWCHGVSVSRCLDDTVSRCIGVPVSLYGGDTVSRCHGGQCFGALVTVFLVLRCLDDMVSMVYYF